MSFLLRFYFTTFAKTRRIVFEVRTYHACGFLLCDGYSCLVSVFSVPVLLSFPLPWCPVTAGPCVHGAVLVPEMISFFLRSRYGFIFKEQSHSFICGYVPLCTE